MTRLSILLTLSMLLLDTSEAFVPSKNRRPSMTRYSSPKGSGKLETLEFKIHPDGRVEEMVRGIKGGDCHKVTGKINEYLGKVISSEPTEEMFEQELVVEQTLTETVGDNLSGDASSWEGKSSW
jgi:hypothetical protein